MQHTKQTNKQRVTTFFWVKKGQIGKISNRYLEEQNINSDSLLVIFVFIYSVGDLASGIKLFHSISILSIFSY